MPNIPKHGLASLNPKHITVGIFVVVFAAIGVYCLLQSYAVTIAASSEAESGALSGDALIVTDPSASGGKAVRLGSQSSTDGGSSSSGNKSTGGSSGSAQNCANPQFQTSQQNGTWTYASNVAVNNNVWGPSGNWTQALYACSPSNWYVKANFSPDQGGIQTYPDTQFFLSNKTVAQYNSLSTCFGEASPTGGEWDYAYDDWLNNFGIEVMVWNDWTDTNIVPPSNARALTIDGMGYHEFKGGGANEWIYTRDTPVKSGCFDMLHIFQDLITHPSTSGITANSVPNAIEYGVEIASTNGSETFKITNATLTIK